MSNKEWSNKVISLIDRYDENKYDVLIPCRLIYILIPTMPKVSNIFEMSILKLINIHINNKELIAKTLCLNEEFVEYILNILKESNLIDNNNKITEEGKSIIEESEEKESNNSPIEYISIGFIQNMLVGKLCDYIIGKNIDKYILQKGNKFYKGNKFFKINQKIEDKYFDTPKPDGYRKIIDINKKYSHLMPRELGKLPQLYNIPKTYNIDIKQDTQENIYLHCQLEYINDEIYVNDGYGKIAEEYIRKLEADWLNNYLESQKTQEISTEVREYKSPTKYSEIENLLKKIDRYSSNDGEYKKIFVDYYQAIYSLIEHILAQILKDNYGSYDNIIENYSSFDIADICKEIGFNIIEDYQFQCKKANLDSPSFNNLISHIILLAKFSDNDKIKQFIEEHPDFIILMNELKKYRDDASHGKHDKDKSCQKMSENLQKFIEKDNIYNITKSLLPDIEVKYWENGKITYVISLDDNLKNAILDIRLLLGNNLYERLPENIKESLIKVFMDENWGINHIYSTYQPLLKYIISNNNLSNEKINKKDVLSQGEIDPKYYKVLNKTNNKYIDYAKAGRDSTLNGCLIVFMYMYLVKKFPKFSNFDKDNPEFINHVAFIIKEREHGNKSSNIETVKNERKKLLKYIKYFMENDYV